MWSLVIEMAKYTRRVWCAIVMAQRKAKNIRVCAVHTASIRLESLIYVAVNVQAGE
jgi:hypothetical protein